MNCKPGDLAIVVASRCVENIGRIVEVLRPAIRGVEFDSRAPDVPTWLVKADRPLGVRGFISGLPRDPMLKRAYADHCLRPITGLPITDDIKDEVTA
jgi:hypothetical protein